MSPFEASDRRRPPTAGQAGICVVEALMAALLALLIFAAVWALFGAGVRQTASTGRRLAGVQGAALLAERLEHDLGQVCWMRGRCPVRIGREADGSAHLTFYVYDRWQSGERRIRPRARAVRYVFDARAGRVRREGPDGTRTLPGAFERVVFGVFPNDGAPEARTFPYLEQPPYRDGAAAGPLPPSACSMVTYQLTCVPAGLLERPPAERRPADRTTVRGAVLLPGKASSERHHFWLPNASSVVAPPQS